MGNKVFKPVPNNIKNNSETQLQSIPMDVDSYDKISKCEVLQKKWIFTFPQEDPEEPPQQTRITLTDKRLIMVSDNGESINRTTRDLRDIRGVGYSINKEHSVTDTQRLKIGIPSYICFALALIFLIVNIIQPNTIYLIPIFIVLGLIMIKPNYIHTHNTKLYTQTLELYINTYSEIQPLGANPIIGEDTSVVKILLPKTEELIIMVIELDNLICELKNCPQNTIEPIPPIKEKPKTAKKTVSKKAKKADN